MSIAENIRQLAKKGLNTAEIARNLGIRYQHAYNALKTRGLRPIPPTATADTAHKNALKESKPSLATDALIAGGFSFSGRWVLSDKGELIPDRPLPKIVGVYAFAKDNTVLYVGVATMEIAKRLYFYGRPGISQRTSKRLNKIIRNELSTIPHIDIYSATPPDLQWNGLPIHGSAGLELGLIKQYDLPWNKRST